MEVLEAIKSRRSIRKYLDKPVVWDMISNILDAGRYAPNAGNLQNWKFVAILDQGKKSAVAEACLRQLWIESAAFIVVIFSEPEKAVRYYGDSGKKYSIQNCAAAAQSMLLEANNLGLGGCWVGAFDEGMLSSALGAEDFAVPEIVLTFGYPDEKPPVPAKLPLEVVAYLNKWRSKIKNVPAYFYYYGPDIKKKIQAGTKLAKKAVSKTAEQVQKISKKIKEKF